MSAATEVKTDRKYTKEHEWALNRASEVLVGISAFAVDQLGDITLVNLDVKPGDTVQAHKAFGTIESVKTLSDLYSPVSGKVVRINADLENKPELINEDPWEKGWMIAIQPSDLDKESQGLLEPSAYSALLESADH
jgi:glycine cleavage system H protein